jgi:hypothetical protein
MLCAVCSCKCMVQHRLVLCPPAYGCTSGFGLAATSARPPYTRTSASPTRVIPMRSKKAITSTLWF